MKKYYIGLSTSGHDPAFAILDDSGNLIFAEATERYLQDKRAWGAAPDHFDHIKKALDANCKKDSEFVIAQSWKNAKSLKLGSQFASISEDQRATFFINSNDAHWSREIQSQAFNHAGNHLRKILNLPTSTSILCFDHHACHATYACATAPFVDSQCLIIDGEGDVGSVSAYHMSKRHVKRLWRSWGPGSLGGYYAWLTGKCGFDWRLGEEWKVMGLAAFGAPKSELVTALSRLLKIERGRPFVSDPQIWPEVNSVIESFVRHADDPIDCAADLAASGQAVYALFADQILESITGNNKNNLVLAGGCALNSSYNGTLWERHFFDAIHIPYAPADDGNAIGAALMAWQDAHPESPLPYISHSPYTGSMPQKKSIEAAAKKGGFQNIKKLDQNRTDLIADLLDAGKTVGVMRGQAEFGPRALGNRSILADPRSAHMKDNINKKIKGRENYRPFAPAIPIEDASDWFEHALPAPYMSFALHWRSNQKARVPAVVHEDGTGRLQTVSPDMNKWFYSLLRDFKERTGIPVLLNTSFNVMGKPMVHTVEDALAVLVTTGLDAIVLDDVLIEKRQI